MGFLRKYKWHPLSATDRRISELLTNLDIELDALDHTDRPDLFFLAYNNAVEYCASILSYKPDEEIDLRIMKTVHYLFTNKTELTNKLIDRSSSGGRLSYDIDTFVEHKKDMTEESYVYFLSLTGLDELIYTYCTVSFGGSRTYDYICEIPDISVGDDVVVPVGDEETEKLAKVVAIKEYRYDEVPYPVVKTKRIIAKYGCGL